MNEFSTEATALQEAEPCNCPGGCKKQCTSFYQVEQPISITPTVKMGTASVTCMGVPDIDCETNEEQTACYLTMRQSVRVILPTEFGVTISAGGCSINCADDDSAGE